ncbi:MAG TPA: AsmA-like C-terminal domain-containing protein [Alphaproteobacteria bacterium]|nr:AsmA-like C-terminal domain-containing protein [Alphaproteobacteria bacterium]
MRHRKVVCPCNVKGILYPVEPYSRLVFMHHPWRLAFKIAASILCVMILAASLLVWRLSNRPMTTSFLTPYIETAIDHAIPGSHSEIAHTLLTWDNIEHSVTFHADDLKVKDGAGNVIAEVPTVDVQLSLFGLMFGQFLPLALEVEHPHFKLERDGQGVLRFGDMTSTSDDGKDSDIKGTIKHIANNLAHAFITHKLQIVDTVLDVEDRNDKSTWSIKIPEISLDRVNGQLTGHANVNLTQKDQTSTVEVSYVYAKHLHNLETKLVEITPSFFAGGHPSTVGLGAASIFDLPLSGDLSVSFDSDLNIEAAGVDIQGHDGRINYPDFWDKPAEIKSLHLKGDYDKETGNLDVPIGDIDFNGPKLSVMATGRAASVPTHDMDFELNAKIDNWPMDRYADLWPKPIITNARDWIVKSLSKGNFDHGEANFRGELSWAHLGDMTLSDGSGKVTASGGHVLYLEGMPALDGVGAVATFDLNQMTVNITGGGIGALRIVPFTLVLTDFEKDTQYIDIPLQFAGPMEDVMKLIDAPKLQYAKAVGLSSDDVSGSAKGTVTLHFPLLNDLLMKDVDVKGDVSLLNIASSKLVKGVDITQGNLNLILDKTGFIIKGPATVNKMPVQIVWQQNFQESENPDKPLKHATVQGFIPDDQLGALGLSMLNGTRGAIPFNLEMTQPNKDLTQVKGKLELTGAELHVDQLNWKKPSTTFAVLKFAVDIPEGKDIQITSIDLQGDQAKASGTATLQPDGHLTALKLEPLMVGRTNANIEFSEAQTEDHELTYKVEGQSLDVSGVTGGNEPAHADPRRKSYSVKLDKLYTSENGFIGSAVGHAMRDAQGWLEINLQGMADSGHKLNVDLAEKDGRRFFSVVCDDFGKALKGMGFTDTVNGGPLEIHGSSQVDTPRVIEGHVKIGSFTVKNLPVLALLINATSPFGFTGLLTDSADFTSLNGKFKWEGDNIELKDVRLAGNSVGMNIEGKVDMNGGNANLNGTLVPFSLVNRIIGSIPLIGDMITGGNGGGVLAVAYTVKGPLSKPDVSVNPVSLLTPGFLRNLFFGGSDDDDDDKQAGPSAPVQPVGQPVDRTPPAKSNINKAK